MKAEDLDTPQLRAALYGVSDIGHPVNTPVQIERGIFTPPSYVARMVLTGVGGFKGYGREEKVEWQVYVRYKGFAFKVRDWKRITWTIEGEIDGEEIRAAADELKRKIAAAGEQLDKVLFKHLKQRADAGHLVLNSSYQKVRFAYEWFRDRVRSSEALALTDVVNDLWPPEFDKAMRVITEKVMLGYAMVGFYFSAVECLFTVLYAFGERATDFKVFRESDWRKRFLTVLPVDKNPGLKPIYEGLLDVKRDVRDELFHGFGGDENLMVAVPFIGIIPLSYESLTSSLHFSPVYTDTEHIERALSIFDEFDHWIADTPPWSCYALYAESGLPVHFSGTQFQRVLEAARDPTTFQKWLDEEVEAYDRAFNDEW